MADYPSILNEESADVRLQIRKFALQISEAPEITLKKNIFLASFMEESDLSDPLVVSNWATVNGSKPIPSKLYGFVRSSFNSLIVMTICEDGSMNEPLLRYYDPKFGLPLMTYDLRVIETLFRIGAVCEETESMQSPMNCLWRNKTVPEEKMELLDAIEAASIRCHVKFGAPLLSSSTYADDPLFCTLLNYKGNQPNKANIQSRVQTDMKDLSGKQKFSHWYCSLIELVRNIVAHEYNIPFFGEITTKLPKFRFDWLNEIIDSHPKLKFIKNYGIF